MKLKKLQLKSESGQACGGGGSHTPLCICQLLQTGRDKRLHLWKRGALTLPSNRKKKTLCLRTAQPIRDCSSPTNEKSLYFGCQASSNGHFGYHSPSQLPLFPYKSKFSFLVLWICLWSTIVCTSQVAIPLLFPNKLTFAGKIPGCHVIKLTKQICPQSLWHLLSGLSQVT